MARKSSADYLKKMKMSVEASRKWRKDDGYDGTWQRLRDMYRGRHFDDYKAEDQMLVNIAFSTINVISPSISVNYPKITVNAVDSKNAANAVIAEAVVNYWWKKRDVRSEFRRSVKDMLSFGHGWIKVGYRFVEEESIDTDEEYSDDVEGGESTTNTVIREDTPFAERVSVHDVFVDPDATSMRDIKWIAQRIRRPINEIKNDKRYIKSAREKVQVVAVSKYSDDPSRKKVHDKNMGYAEIWEYYDIANGSMSIFCETSDQFLVKPTKMPYSFGQPFVMLRNYDVPDMFYPIGDLESIEPLQRELNETRSQMMNHRKKFSRKYLYKESAFDQLGRSALESDDDNVMVPVMSDEPIAGVVTAFPAVINPPEFYNQSNMIIGDIDRISGVSEFQRGAVSEIRRTATESSLLQDAANARTSDKLAVVEQAIAEVGRRMMALAQQYMTGEQVARVTGKDGEPMWVTFDRDYLAGDFDFEVAAGSTQPHNESFKRQMALQMVDAMSPFAGAGIVNMQKLAAYVLQFGFGVKNPDEFLQAPPPPVPAEGEMGMPPQSPQTAPQAAGGSPAGPESSLPPEIVAMLQQGQGAPPA
jgi:hypothetical protein